MDLFELSAILTLDTSQYEQGISGAESKASGFGTALQGAAKVGVAAMATVGTAIVGTGTALAKGAGGVAAYGDNIDKMSQKMGMSAQSYQEWDAVMRHSGTSMDAMKASMKTLASAAETDSDAFEQLGISQEEIANMSQEELFEATIKALQNVDDETKRTYLAGKTLGRGATELGALLNTSAEDTQAMRDRVRELGGVMSDDAVKASAAYQDSLQDMQTAFSSVSRNMLSEFLPSMSTVMNGLTEIFSGNSDKGIALVTQGISGILDGLQTAIPKFMEVGSSIMSAIGKAIMDNFPAIVENGTQIVINLISGLVSHIPDLLSAAVTMLTVMITTIIDNFPKFLDTGKQMVSKMSGGIGENIPEILKKMGDVLSKLIATIMNKLPDLLKKGVEIIARMAQGIGQNMPAILSAMAKVIAQVLATIARNLPEFLRKGVELIGKILSGIIRAVPDIIRKIPSIVSDMAREFMSYDWGNLGLQIIEGIAKGIANSAGSIIDAAKDAAYDAFEAAKNFLGIESPSKLFRNKVGKMISEGMALGIGDGEDNVISAIGDLNDEMSDIEPAEIESDIVLTRNTSTNGDEATAGSFNFAPVLNIYGSDGQDIQELARIVMDELTFMYDRERAAYGTA